MSVIGMFFETAWPWILGAVRFVAFIALAMLILWLVLGRGKNGERRMTGLLRLMSISKTGSPPGPGNGGGMGGAR